MKALRRFHLPPPCPPGPCLPCHRPLPSHPPTRPHEPGHRHPERVPRTVVGSVRRSRTLAPMPGTARNAALRAAPTPVRVGGRVGRVAPDEGPPQLHRPPLPPPGAGRPRAAGDEPPVVVGRAHPRPLPLVRPRRLGPHRARSRAAARGGVTRAVSSDERGVGDGGGSPGEKRG